MSNLKDEYIKILSDIETHIDSIEDKEYMLEKISELNSLYIGIIDKITEINNKKLEEIENKLFKMQTTVSMLKNDFYEDEDMYDVEIVCPYCNHEFITDINDELKDEIKCPECHNIIELDWDDEDCHKDNNCSHCDGECKTIKEITDVPKNDEKGNNEDDDM